MSMASFKNIEIMKKLRLCTVNGKLGYFHCWEHYSKPVEASILMCGVPEVIISFVRGIVEFPEGVGYANPADIKFCDDEHAYLCAMAKHHEENEKEKHNEYD